MERSLSQPMRNNSADNATCKPMNLPRLTARTCLCAMLCALAGCLVGPRYHQPAATLEPPPGSYKEAPVHFKDGVGWQAASPSDAMLRGEWWKVFKDPELNALEEQLNINNQNIKQSFENFMVARAIADQAVSQMWPTLTANGSALRSATGAATPMTAIMTSLNLSWEPDFWGRIRNTIRAAQYNAQLSAADLENERLTEQTALAVFFFEIRGQDSLEKLFADTIAADKAALEYNRVQYKTGITGEISVVQAQNTLENAQATATNLGVLRAQYENAIAMLVGKPASSFSIPVRVLNTEPPPIPVGMPSQLIERRPDISAAERAMAAANAQIGVAYSAYFPSVTLGGDGGYKGTKFGNLFSAKSRFWSVGPAVSEEIIDGGLRNATVHQYVATYNATLANYRQTVLTGFQQVENYLAQVRILARQLIQQQAAEKSARRYLDLEMNRYRTGLDPYLDVTIAQTTLLADQQAVINVRIQEMTGAVQLIEALGGGWDRSQLPSAWQVSAPPGAAETAIQH